MIATIAAPIFDFSGYVELDLVPEYTDGQVSRRVNRVKTLDGGATITDGGFSDADRTFELKWATADSAFEANIERMVRDHPSLEVSTRSGVFLAVPEAYTPRAGESTLRLLVVERISA